MEDDRVKEQWVGMKERWLGGVAGGTEGKVDVWHEATRGERNENKIFLKNIT